MAAVDSVWILLELVTAGVEGLFVGSLLTEAVILVPYWRKMKPDDFLRLHGSMGPQLFRYFAPLTVLATLLPVASVVAGVFTRNPSTLYWLASAALMASMMAIYFLYFRRANDSFKTGSVGPAGLPAELARWAAWHWIRVAIGLAAFFFALLALTV